MRHDEVAAYHAELTARLVVALPRQLVGVYAGGSVALGGYTPGRSDLDVAAVCSGHLSARRKRAVVAQLRHESLPCPARGLEFVLYPEQTTREPSTDAGFELELNTGSGLPFLVSYDPADRPSDLGLFWYAIDRSIYASHGVPLFGPPSMEVFTRIPREMLLPVLVEAVCWTTRRGGRNYEAVLNACRAWRYAVENTWSSKQTAGEWALTNVADTEIVAAALTARLDDQSLAHARVEDFLHEIAGNLAASAK